MLLPFTESYEIFHTTLSKWSGVDCPYCLTREAFTWAYYIVDSRCFWLDYCQWKAIHYQECSSEEEARGAKGFAMYPLVDLVNHKPKPLKYRYDTTLRIKIQAEPPSAIFLKAS